MTEIDRHFAELESAARSFRVAAAGLAGIIERFESKLSSLGIDFDVWLVDSPLETHGMSVSQSNVATRIERHLGFGPDPRPGREGRILSLRLAEVGESALRDDDEVLRVLEVTPLTEVSLEQRTAALRDFPRLLEAMTQRARESAEVIRRVQELTDRME